MHFRGFTLAALSVACISLFAQSPSVVATVPVKITVHDPAGAVIPDAEVKVNTPTAPSTDANGKTVLSLQPGEYDLLASARGFTTAKQHVRVLATGGQTIEFTLSVGGGWGPVVVANDQRLQTSTPGTFAIVGSPASLTITVTAQEPHALGVADFATLPHKTVTFHNVHTKADETYSGVPLTDLLAKYGAPTGDKLRGKALSDYIIATGADGYKAVLALAETDPSFHPGDVIVADTMDGKPLDAKTGPFRLVVTEDKRPARSVHNLVSIELRTAD